MCKEQMKDFGVKKNRSHLLILYFFTPIRISYKLNTNIGVFNVHGLFCARGDDTLFCIEKSPANRMGHMGTAQKEIVECLGMVIIIITVVDGVA